ncbi:MAG TPA: hypothetical protein VK061_02195 [Bacillota bacterium]|nr:hypothetical protein [Bacillota bacterium]
MSLVYFAVTFDVCEHMDFVHQMNTFRIGCTDCIDEQAEYYADLDIAPLVKVYEMDVESKQSKLYKEYHFEKHDCGCGELGV